MSPEGTPKAASVPRVPGRIRGVAGIAAEAVEHAGSGESTIRAGVFVPACREAH